MAKDREPKSEQNHEQFGPDGIDDEFEEEEVEVDEQSFEQPFCPRCGWHNTRPSHTSTVLDLVVRMFGLRPFRCRSCGNRFRVMRRVSKA
jgi:hypothetical protein